MRRIVTGTACWAALVVLVAGCVERRMTIRTNPSGAMVYVNHQEVGLSPVSLSYVYYGTNLVRLVRDGYETTSVVQRVDPPIYDTIFTELLVELLPIRFKDWREFTYELQRPAPVAIAALRARAEDLRQDALVASEQPFDGGDLRGRAAELAPVRIHPDDPIWFRDVGEETTDE